MFTAAAFIPAPPLLVPELANAAASETADLRRAVLDAAAALAERSDRLMAIGVVSKTDARSVQTASHAYGTFKGFGVDVRVALGPDVPDPSVEPDAEMPLPALIAGWVRGQVASDLLCDVEYVTDDEPPASAAVAGTQLRAQLHALPERVGVLVIADGTNTLTERAPGSYDVRAEAFERELAAALDTGDARALATLDPQLCGELGVTARSAWHVLAALFGGDRSGVTRVSHRFDCAPYGVGYHVGVWLP